MNIPEKNNQTNPNEAPDELENEKISKIRDILFGNNISEYEQRFKAVEERLNLSVSELSDDTSNKLKDLELFVKEELKTILTQLKQEESERNEAVRKLQKEFDTLEDKLARLKESTNDAHRDIRQFMKDKNHELETLFKQQMKEIKNHVDEDLNVLRTVKTDRSSLAILLTELAMKIAGKEDKPDTVSE
ncbi:MAG: hypothetical protein JXA23_08350 [Bacteroidales bacterium]|nr:hypothetical protein [Bacteroidales bacterium]